MTQESIDLFEGQLSTTIASLYTAPAGYEVDVQAVTLVNITGTAATARLDRVPSGSTDGTTEEVYNESVAANTTVELPTGGESILVTLMPGDTLTGAAGTATAIDCTVSGIIRRK